MKRIAKEVYDFTDEQLWGPSESRNSEDRRYPRPDGTFLSARVALQLLGSEWGRFCYPDTWTVYLRRVIDKIHKGYFYSESRGVYRLAGKTSKYKGIVIPNCRFQNEIEAVKMMGGKTVRLARLSVTREESLALGVKNHETETEQMTLPDSLFDYVLNVPEGYDSFYKEIDICVGRLCEVPVGMTSEEKG